MPVFRYRLNWGVISLELRGKTIGVTLTKSGGTLSLSPPPSSLSRPFLFHFPFLFPFHATHIQLSSLGSGSAVSSPADIDFGAIWESNLESDESNFL